MPQNLAGALGVGRYFKENCRLNVIPDSRALQVNIKPALDAINAVSNAIAVKMEQVGYARGFASL